jgi:iron complex outermembrane receptor protein
MRRDRFNRRGLLVSASLASLLAAASAYGQTTPPTGAGGDPQAAEPAAPEAQTQEQEIVVQGFRASLDNALNLKREETAAVDSIVAEDIGKFPDSNLAESMQRIPGVALSRGDGGEGRNISVRGLGAQFTRVRINGMEGVSQVSGSDIRGGVATGRSFDFVTFPTEIFSSLAVRKTLSADVEEGSLGATVDLRAPKPFDQKKDFVLSATARGIYNDISKKADPRLSALVSKKFGDTFGVLASVAYSKRHIDEYAYSAVDILPTYVAGQSRPVTLPGATTPTNIIFPFCTPVGYTYQGVAVTSPAPGYANSGVSVGADAANCSTGNPRTSTAAAYDYIMSRTGVSGRPGGGVFLRVCPVR